MSNTTPSTATVDLKILTAPFPQTAIKQRAGGGGKQLSYIEGHSVILRLNAATGNNWTFSILKEWQDGDILKAQVELTLPGMGTRQHIGVQKVSPNGGEDLAKGHVTDALKKAATLFGVGLELYGADYEEAGREAAALVEARQSKRIAKQRYADTANELGLASTPDDLKALFLKQSDKEVGDADADVLDACTNGLQSWAEKQGLIPTERLQNMEPTTRTDAAPATLLTVEPTPAPKINTSAIAGGM